MEQKILNQFLFNKTLKFNEIEKNIKARSNKLAYHIKKLIAKGILEKQKETYKLSETAEYLIPYLSKKRAALPVILIHIGDKNNAFLFQRQKRPFKDALSLPGGRLLINESIPEAAKRIMKEKFNMEIKIKKIKSVSLEHVKKNNKKIHSFLLILVSAKTNQKITLTKINKNKSKIIPSDFHLIKSQEYPLKINTMNTKI